MKERTFVLMFLCFSVSMMNCGLPPEKEMPNFKDAVAGVDIDGVINNHFDTGIDKPENPDTVNDDGEKFDTPKNDEIGNDSNDTDHNDGDSIDTKDTFDAPQETDGDQGYDTDDSEVSHDAEVESEVYCLPVIESCNNQDDDCDDFIDEDLELGDCDVGTGECKTFGKNICLDGAIVCDAVAGQTSLEICDEKDNDCDGETDEDLGLGDDCKAGVGECKANGKNICVENQVVCDALAGEPGVEYCNSLDDNCDGETDEDWPELGQDCDVGIGECKVSNKMVCDTDGDNAVCDAIPLEPIDELCDGLDNDCDDEIDEDFEEEFGMPCSVGVGECMMWGIKICAIDGNGLVCDAVEGEPIDEICDYKDNDCDTFVDEDFSELGTNCSVGVGECEKSDVYVCDLMTGQSECDVEPGEPVEELCDGLDNNCDSETDELWIDELGADCENGIGECKTTGHKICSNDGLTTECDAIPSEPSAELCNYLDDNCDGENDEIFYDLGTDCDVGVGECKAYGLMVCDFSGENTVCDAVPGMPTDELCDDLDNNCDGFTDENWSELGDDCGNGVGECKAGGKIICEVPAKGEDDATVCNAKPFEPQAEICDYKDNNCNGLNDKDDAFPMLDTNCSIGDGECVSSGVYVCDLNTGFAKCGAPVILPQEEICDNKDNNCNKLIDDVDASKLQSDNANCGACFAPCMSLPGAASVTCVAAKCTPVTCTAKYYDADKIPENGCECTITSGAVEICDGIDNDCDGQIDEWCDNLVMYLPFDGNWNDKSKYGNNVTPFNGAGFTSDAILGQAAYFDGVDDYAVVADSASMDSIKEEFTWFIAVKPIDIAGAKSVIFNKMSYMPAFIAIWSDMSPCPSTDCFCFKISGSNAACQPAVELNKWFMFVVRYKKGELTIYLNGNQIWQGTASYPQNIGGNIEISGDAGVGIKETIDEFIFYNKALSDAEITDYYQKIK